MTVDVTAITVATTKKNNSQDKTSGNSFDEGLSVLQEYINSKDSEFQMVKPKPSRQQEKKTQLNTVSSNQNGLDSRSLCKQKFITGIAEDSHYLTTMGKREFLFVTRLGPSTSCEDIINYLKYCKCDITV